MYTISKVWTAANKTNKENEHFSAAKMFYFASNFLKLDKTITPGFTLAIELYVFFNKNKNAGITLIRKIFI